VSFFWLANHAPEPGGVVYNGSSNSHVRYALPDGTTRSFLPRWQLRVSEDTVQQIDRRAVVSMNRIGIIFTGLLYILRVCCFGLLVVGFIVVSLVVAVNNSGNIKKVPKPNQCRGGSQC
jgi:hypothetical protein